MAWEPDDRCRHEASIPSSTSLICMATHPSLETQCHRYARARHCSHMLRSVILGLIAILFTLTFCLPSRPRPKVAGGRIDLHCEALIDAPPGKIDRALWKAPGFDRPEHRLVKLLGVEQRPDPMVPE